MKFNFFPLLLLDRSGDFACTAYVTFKDAYSQETACLLSVSEFNHYKFDFECV